VLTSFPRLVRPVAGFILVTLSFGVFWALAPLAAGLSPHVIMSGSMTPRLHPGDVVVTLPVGPDRLRRGMVISFPDPTDARRNIMHRIVARESDGTLRTRGDANQSADSTPVPVDSVVGMGVLRIPFIGLPAYWERTSRYVPLGVATMLLFLSAVIVTGGTGAPAEHVARHRRTTGRHAALTSPLPVR
jgi:signal peptidase